MTILPKSIPAIYPPTVITGERGRFAIFVASNGNHWYHVDESFTHEDAMKHWVKEKQREVINTKKQVSVKSWEVANSKNDGHYTVQVVNERWSCTCPGFGFRRMCKHVQQTKAKQN
jgi:hypothetical protein